ncbi:YciI family protein [Rhizobium alvei]|uniref:YciI family protein n=1 Tax=Rhizobium alvei TaxID=1132659 RepID=A0ABT8YMB1_9HYPH|nr:YciI family protein [Rhizobium alvei]MDO6964864.1 YciI family protein [Rhizobium alvei]
MKFMALIYNDPTTMTPPGTPDFGKMMEGYRIANETYHRDGVYVSGDALQGASTATTIRVRNGKTESMDGPFAESKEQLAGFYILDCKDLDEAIRYASLIPGAASGAVELRPVMVFDR